MLSANGNETWWYFHEFPNGQGGNTKPHLFPSKLLANSHLHYIAALQHEHSAHSAVGCKGRSVKTQTCPVSKSLLTSQTGCQYIWNHVIIHLQTEGITLQTWAPAACIGSRRANNVLYTVSNFILFWTSDLSSASPEDHSLPFSNTPTFSRDSKVSQIYYLLLYKVLSIFEFFCWKTGYKWLLRINTTINLGQAWKTIVQTSIQQHLWTSL